MLYKNLRTREDFRQYINEEINNNIFDMTDEEVHLIQRYIEIICVFQKIRLKLPKRKLNMDIFIHSAKQKFETILKYVFIPDNLSTSLYLRMLAENLIILQFMIDNEPKYLTNWFFWIGNHLMKENLDSDIEFKSKYHKWLKGFRDEYNQVGTNKLNFEQLLSNKYGWSYPRLKSFINLESISKECNRMDAFQYFKHFSMNVHNNNPMQNISSRFEEDTYKIIVTSVELMVKYYETIDKFIINKKEIKRIFYSLYYEIVAIAFDYVKAENKKYVNAK